MHGRGILCPQPETVRWCTSARRVCSRCHQGGSAAEVEQNKATHGQRGDQARDCEHQEVHLQGQGGSEQRSAQQGPRDGAGAAHPRSPAQTGGAHGQRVELRRVGAQQDLRVDGGGACDEDQQIQHRHGALEAGQRNRQGAGREEGHHPRACGAVFKGVPKGEAGGSAPWRYRRRRVRPPGVGDRPAGCPRR